MTDLLRVGSWASIDDGCPMRYRIPFGGVVSLSFGDVLDLTFDDGSMRALAELSAEAVREIDARTGGAEPGTGAGQLASPGDRQ